MKYPRQSQVKSSHLLLLLPAIAGESECELQSKSGANDNRANDPRKADIQALHLEPQDARESALVRTLSPGAYTVIIRGHTGGTGIGLVEVYNVGSN
jgi:hypothetical protein